MADGGRGGRVEPTCRRADHPLSLAVADWADEIMVMTGPRNASFDPLPVLGPRIDSGVGARAHRPPATLRDVEVRHGSPEVSAHRTLLQEALVAVLDSLAGNPRRRPSGAGGSSEGRALGRQAAGGADMNSFRDPVRVDRDC